MQWLRANAARREFESFVADSTGPLLRTAFLMARDLAEAEDLVQETFLRAGGGAGEVRRLPGGRRAVSTTSAAAGR
jgi:DNA-directed RNA polymerase specialized sigma24 family protein